MAVVKNKPEYRYDIDGLRSLAILPVLLFHAGIPGFSGGFVGVDIFFVISGFLITGILHREISSRQFSLIKFYERRARRILPALFSVIVCSLFVAWFIFSPHKYTELAGSALATLLFASNVWFWKKTSNYFASDADLEPLLHTWSLAVEEQFYIVFPLMLLIIMKWPHKTMVIAVFMACVISFTLSVYATYQYSSASFYLIPTRAWELGIGSLLALGFFSPIKKTLVREVVAFLGFFAILVTVIFYSDDVPFPGIGALLPCFGAFALIWTGIPQSAEGKTTKINQLLSNPVLVWIGLISYSLYLWHWPIFAFSRYLFGSVDLPLIYAVPALALSFILAFLSYKFIEQPFRRPTSSGGFSQRAIFSMSAVSMSLLAVFCLAVFQFKGIESRLPHDAVTAFKGSENFHPKRAECGSYSPYKDLCTIGASVEPTVLLWGDSHVGAAFPGFDVAFKEAGLSANIAFKDACPPILNVIRADQPVHHKCDDFNNAILDRLKSSPNIQTVILHARWALAAEGKRVESESGKKPVLRSTRTGFEKFKAFEEEFQNTIDVLLSLGKKVVILEAVPEIGKSVPEMIGKSILLGQQNPSGPSATSIKERHRRANQVIRKAADKENVWAISLLSYMCDDVSCAIVMDDHTLYYDDDHLSVYAAERFVPKALKSVMGVFEN